MIGQHHYANEAPTVPYQPQAHEPTGHPHNIPQSQAYPSEARRRKSRKKQGIPWMVIIAVGIIVLMAISAAGIGLAIIYFSQPRIADGVTVNGVSVGGMSVSAARTQLLQNQQDPMLVATDGDRSWLILASALGITVDVEATLSQAELAPPNSDVQTLYNVDLVKAQDGLIFLSELSNITPTGGETPQAGRALDIPAMLNRLYVDVTGEVGDGTLDLTMLKIEPPAPEPTPTPEQQYSGVTTVHVVEQGQELALIAQYYNVAMEDIIAMNGLTNANLLYIGQELTIPAAGRYNPSAVEAPPAPIAVGKAIVVSTKDQWIYAYENGQLVHSHVTSTGRPETPTVLGDYKIYVKYRQTDMRGEDYYLPNVPYTMYFYQGYGIHGTYWHNSFGRPMSHGCVNLPTSEAEWFFNWAEVGTLVRVI